MGERPKPIAARKRRFLKAIAEMPNVAAAARAAGVVRQTPYEWAERDKDFKAAWDVAQQEGVDRLEEAVWGRAVDGWDENHVNARGEVYSVRKYSDQLAARLLVAHRPEKYAEKVKAEVSQDGPIKFTLDLGGALGGDKDG